MILHDGVEYVRVSKILSQFTDFSKIDPAVLERKRKIGSEVHDAIDAYHKGDFPILREETIGYFKSFDIWRELASIRVVQSEERYFCQDYLLTGKIDALIKMAGSSDLILVDFKTSAQVSNEIWQMQAHMYAYLIHKSGQDISNRYLFIKLDKFGSLPKICEYKYDVQMWFRCLHAILEYPRK